MDNLTTGQSGEIYSAFQEKSSEDINNQISPLPSAIDNPPQIQPEVQPEGNYPPENIPPQMPAFAEEHKGKKIIFILLAFIIILGLIFLAVSLIKNRKPPAPKEIKLTYWGLFEDKTIMQPIIDEYKRTHQNITIDYIKQDQKQYQERLQAALSRGQGPDVFRFHNTWMPMLISLMQPMPKTVYANTEYENTFFPVATMDLKVGDNYYAVPLMIDGLLLFYNEDILKNANIAVPQTWDEVVKAAAKLTVKEKGKVVTSGIALGTAENIEHFSDILGLMMLQNGVDMGKSLFKCNNSTSTDCGIQVLTFYRSFAEAPNNTWDETLENSIIAFAGGKVAMIFAPSWQIYTIKGINPNLNFKTAKVPQLPCEKQPCPEINWASYWVEGVSNKSAYNAEAWEFLKYLTSEDTMKKLYELEIKQRQLFGEVYARVDLAKTLINNQYIAPLVEEAPTMSSFYLASKTMDGEDTGINSILIKYLKDAVNSLSQGVSPETALKTADDGFRQTLTRFGIKSTN